MELALNLVWVGVAIVGILVQIVMLMRAGASAWRRESQWQRIVAMACALVILFFVISMTDDLHDQALLLEERKLGRITLTTRASGHSASDRSLTFLSWQFLPVAPFSPPPLAAMSWFVPAFELPFAPAPQRDSLRERAPPAPQA